MPNRIEDSVRDKIRVKMLDVLSGVSHANGYNCQPFVTDDPEVPLASLDVQHTIYVHVGDEDIEERETGPRFYCSLEVLIAGYASKGTGNLQQETNKLLQDVRGVLSNSIQAFATFIGRGIDFEIGSASVDDGLILGDGYGGFVLPVTVKYWTGKDW